MINMSKAELQDCLDRAAEEGARRALEQVGLHDEDAGGDVRDIRALIQTWRVAKRTAIKTAVHNFINLIFLVILAGLAVKMGISWGDGK